jgi:regulator of protease activity HflC (stomatin/prohibitin superfamily)
VFSLRQSVEAARLIAEGRAQANAAIATANATASTIAAASSTTTSTEPSFVADTGTNDAAAAATHTIDGDDHVFLTEFSADELAEMDEKVQERYAQM